MQIRPTLFISGSFTGVTHYQWDSRDNPELP
jgi:hypothetical protein